MFIVGLLICERCVYNTIQLRVSVGFQLAQHPLQQLVSNINNCPVPTHNLMDTKSSKQKKEKTTGP